MKKNDNYLFVESLLKKESLESNKEIFIRNDNRIIIIISRNESKRNIIHSIINLDTNDVIIDEAFLYITDKQLEDFHKASKHDEALYELVRINANNRI